MSRPRQPYPPAPMPSSVQKVPLRQRRGLQVGATAVVALVLGVGVGIGVGFVVKGSVEDSSEYRELARERRSVEGELEVVRAERDETKVQVESIMGDLPEREAALTDREVAITAAEADLEEREESIAAAEVELVEREKVIGIAEAERAANTISGSGMYKVGEEMSPGTYRTDGSSSCYYAVLRSTNTADIITNNLPNGPGFVTVREGQYFETNRCGEWVRQ